ncbi:uncharacterized protein LOC143742257 [Siphateles boraxobius]|uniref:uncharacterized protein LOC143742257 n=1 Tax=Siphateles boraxobius TaxID=180520 RepID=UPI00406330AA
MNESLTGLENMREELIGLRGTLENLYTAHLQAAHPSTGLLGKSSQSILGLGLQRYYEEHRRLKTLGRALEAADRVSCDAHMGDTVVQGGKNHSRVRVRHLPGEVMHCGMTASWRRKCNALDMVWFFTLNLRTQPMSLSSTLMFPALLLSHNIKKSG